MALWTPDGFVDDRWTTVLEGGAIPETGAIIVPLGLWSPDLAARRDPVGVLVAAAKDAPAHLAEAAKRPLVAFAFAKFVDGRAFSYARLLRARHGFKGELRAVGDVLFDEIGMMLRCGFGTFEITNAPTLKALQAGRRPGLPLLYQPGLAPSEAPAGERPWLRKLAV
jgi:uncharacterized protein (DUF934 family)